ncbi:hypothetical protein AB1N83_004977 [Pleurotus pulmonarius]
MLMLMEHWRWHVICCTGTSEYSGRVLVRGIPWQVTTSTVSCVYGTCTRRDAATLDKFEPSLAPALTFFLAATENEITISFSPNGSKSIINCRKKRAETRARRRGRRSDAGTGLAPDNNCTEGTATDINLPLPNKCAWDLNRSSTSSNMWTTRTFKTQRPSQLTILLELVRGY